MEVAVWQQSPQIKTNLKSLKSLKSLKAWKAWKAGCKIICCNFKDLSFWFWVSWSRISCVIIHIKVTFCTHNLFYALFGSHTVCQFGFNPQSRNIWPVSHCWPLTLSMLHFLPGSSPHHRLWAVTSALLWFLSCSNASWHNGELGGIYLWVSRCNWSKQLWDSWVNVSPKGMLAEPQLITFIHVAAASEGISIMPLVHWITFLHLFYCY